MEDFKYLRDFFETEIKFLTQNTPKNKEEIDLKLNSISDKIDEAKKKIILLRDKISPQNFNQIYDGLRKDVNSLKTALQKFIDKFSDKSESEFESEEWNNICIDENDFELKKNKIRNNFEFPMETAMNCIPEFYGQSEDLNSFIDQINFFYRKIPKGFSQIPLINVVKLKLKGNAKHFANCISNLSWQQIEEKLKEEFVINKSPANIFKQIGTLSQKPSESFKAYKNRALEILNDLESVEKKDDNSLMRKNLRLYFIAGLKNSQLQITARNIDTPDFHEFVKILDNHCISNEEFEDIQKHVQKMNLEPYKGVKNQYYNNINARPYNDFSNFGFQHYNQANKLYQNQQRQNQNLNKYRGKSFQKNNFPYQSFYPQRKN